jgi:antirestriction protein ArdC
VRPFQNRGLFTYIIVLNTRIIYKKYRTFNLLTKSPKPLFMSKKSAAAATKSAYVPTDVYQLITDRFITALEGGTIPWRKPWNEQHGAPRNYVTGRAYTGVNAFLLHYSSDVPFFLTFKQTLELGGHIRKGAHGFPVVYFQVSAKKNEQTQEEERRFILKKYTVFSVQDVEGVELKLPELTPATHTPVEAAEAIVKGWAGCPRIVNMQQRAYYSPVLDYVNMPKPETFTSPELYYSVLFHELIHSTGHTSRLNRPDLTKSDGFGSPAYAREELTAEMGAAFLCAGAGLKDEQRFENSVAYVQNWLKALRNDKKLVIQAAGRASKAAAFILGTESPDDEAGQQAAPTGPDEEGGATPPPAQGPALVAAPGGQPAPEAQTGVRPQAKGLLSDFLNVRRVLTHPAFSAAEQAIHEAAAAGCECRAELRQLHDILLLIAERWEDAQHAAEGEWPEPSAAPLAEALAEPELSGDHHEIIAYAVQAFAHLRPFEQPQQASELADQISQFYATTTPQTRRVCEVLRAHPAYPLPFRCRLA